jgi:hypothetical protein
MSRDYPYDLSERCEHCGAGPGYPCEPDCDLYDEEENQEDETKGEG